MYEIIIANIGILAKYSPLQPKQRIVYMPTIEETLRLIVREELAKALGSVKSAPVTAPKKRGRPAKQVVAAPAIPAAPKKRGRPAKKIEAAPVVAAAPAADAPKKRGRPRKNPEAVVVVAPKKRGRPAKADKAVKAPKASKAPKAPKAPKAAAPEVTLTGKDIVAMRTKAGVGAPKFSKQIGVSIATVYNWEKLGDKPLKLRTSAKKKLAKFLSANAG